MRFHSDKSITGQTGFTLLELIISTGMGIVVLAGVLQMLLGFQTTEHTASAMTKLEENGRLALQILAKDIEMAGYQGCADPEVVPPNIVAKGLPVVKWREESLKGWYFTGGTWESGTEGGGAVPTMGIGGAVNNNDAIRVLRGANSNMALVDSMSNNSSSVKVAAGQDFLKQGDFVLIVDCENTDVFRISNVPKNGDPEMDLAHESGAYNVSDGLSKAYAKDVAKVMRVQENTYFIGETGRQDNQGNEILALFRANQQGQKEEIVEGVESLQLRYGEKLSGGAIRFYRAGDNDIDWNDISIVQISILVSTDPILFQDDTKSYVLSGIEVTHGNNTGSISQYQKNKRLRRSYSVNVAVKNRIN